MFCLTPYPAMGTPGGGLIRRVPQPACKRTGLSVSLFRMALRSTAATSWLK